MKPRLFIGIALIAIAAFLLSFRGKIVGYVTAKWEARRLPEAVTYDEAAKGTEVQNVTDAAQKSTLPSDSTTSSSSGSPRTVSAQPTATTPAKEESSSIPAQFNLAVPFTSQAPYEDWNLPYKESCEEASVAMVDAFYGGRTFTQASATSEILAVVDWENKTFDHYEDTDAAETARILRERYGYRTVRVVENPTIDMIKREVFQGRPVILPAAGQLLGNRYFRQPGPVYHMLVVRGWTKDGMIITNDPGTKRGQGYLYKPEVLMNAMHDWNGGDVLNGRKVMIVVEK